MDYAVGQRVVYFPTDGQLNEEFARENNLLRIKDESGNNVGGYLDPAKRNIKALKLRGEQSDGLVLPIEVLSKYTDITQLKDGDAITVLNGVEICKKYIPKAPHRRNPNPNSKSKKSKKRVSEKISYPYFAEHVDTAQLAYNLNAFRPGDTCYITLKMHGTSARTSNAIEVTTKKMPRFLRKLGLHDKESTRYKIISGSRRCVLKSYDGGYYGSNAFREKYHKLFAEKLPKGMEVFYEIVGYVHDDTPIMGRCKNSLVQDKEFRKQYGDVTTFSYGCDVGENECYVYRMTMTNEDGYKVELPWEQVEVECDKMGVKCVPTFEKFTFTTTDDLMQRVEQYYEGPDPIGRTHIREGVVVRIDNRPSFTAYKHKGFHFKCLESIVKDTSDAPDMEEAEELLIESEAENGYQ